MKRLLIAEVKTKSPFGFESDRSWDEVFEVANQFGNWLSVHTDPKWGGSFGLVSRAKALTDKPVLAKGMHETDDEMQAALDAGADFVLTVREKPSDAIDPAVCLYEPYTLQGLFDINKAIGASSLRAVWNARNVKTGGQKQIGFNEARNVTSAWLVQASMIKTIEDVHPKADAVLVGENLEKFVTSL